MIDFKKEKGIVLEHLVRTLLGYLETNDIQLIGKTTKLLYKMDPEKFKKIMSFYTNTNGIKQEEELQVQPS